METGNRIRTSGAGKIDGKITARTRQSAVSDRFNPSFSRGEIAGRGCRGLRVRRVPGRAGRQACVGYYSGSGGSRAYVAGAGVATPVLP
jgi:hypothetical protein